jgi:hypothetical protein
MNQADYRVKHLNSAQGKPDVKNNEAEQADKFYLICLKSVIPILIEIIRRYRMLTWSQIMSPPFTWLPLHSSHFEFSQE